MVNGEKMGIRSRDLLLEQAIPWNEVSLGQAIKMSKNSWIPAFGLQ